MNNSEFKWPEGEELLYVRPPVEEYHGKLDYFYSPKLFPELNILKENWKEIRDEILNYEKNNGQLEGFSAVSAPEVQGGTWTMIYLMSFMRKYHKNQSMFPFTMSLIDKIPNCVLASISVLPPNTEIKPHYGDTNGIVRAHLGLIVPAPYPTIAIKVGDEEQGWVEGDFMCFINVHKHQVWNRSNARRYVLMIDFVPKPLKNRQMEICTKGLGSQSFIYVYRNIPFIKYLPEFIYDFMSWSATKIWRLYLPIQRKFKFL